MKPQAQLSPHALDRAYTRLHLAPGEIIGLLDRDLAIPLGIQPWKKRSFRLFYSQCDNDWFVAVQAEDGEVVTIMPFDWTPWQIDPQMLKRAKQLLVGAASSAPAAPKPAPTPPVESSGATADDLPPYQDGSQYFELRCARWSKGGTISIGRVKARPYGYSLETLAAHPDFIGLVRERIASLVKHRQVKTIFITLGPLGKSSRVHQVPWPPK